MTSFMFCSTQLDDATKIVDVGAQNVKNCDQQLEIVTNIDNFICRMTLNQKWTSEEFQSHFWSKVLTQDWVGTNRKSSYSSRKVKLESYQVEMTLYSCSFVSIGIIHDKNSTRLQSR